MPDQLPIRPPVRRPRLARLVVWLDGQSPTQLFVSAGVMVAGLAVSSSLIGSELALAIFYLAPIGVAAYFVGRRQGRWIAVLSGLSWTVVAEALIPTSTPAAALVWSGLTRVVLFLVVAELLSALRVAFDHERHLARTDPLTGAANPRAFLEEAGLELLRTRRYRRWLSLVHLDLDGFKAVNDTQGHAEGDLVLRETVAALRRALRRTDLVARLGGDEFAVLLPETGVEAVRIVVGKMHEALRAALAAGGWPVTASAGVVTCAPPPDQVETLLQRADRLTYRSKAGGKNQVSYETVTAWSPAAAGSAA